MVYVVEAKYIQDYKIQVRFNDQKEGIVDLKEIITQDPRAVFHELTDLNLFKNFRVDMDTVVWENGLDLAPEFLYDQIKITPIYRD